MLSNFIRTKTVTGVCETGAVATGDIIMDTTAIPDACLTVDGPTYLVGCNIFDLDDNTAGDIRILFMAASTSLGSLNSAPNISDANGVNIIADILVASADWHDVGGFKFVRIDPAKLPIPMHPASGTTTVYFAILAGSATTNTASGIRVRFYFNDAYPM